jgi:hypothetical protein
MRTNIAAVVVALAAAGCGSRLLPEPLQQDEAVLLVDMRAALGTRPVAVSAATPEIASHVASVLRTHGFAADTIAAEGAVRLDVAGPFRRTLDEPFLTFFSIFVVPVWTGGTEYAMTCGGAAEPSTCDTSGTFAYGPVALALTAWPRWNSWVLYMWGVEDGSVGDDRLAVCAARALAAATEANR